MVKDDPLCQTNSSNPPPQSLILLHDVTFIVDVTVQIVAEDL